MLSRIFVQSLLALGVLLGCTSATTLVTVNGTAGHSISPLLYGLMFEDINSGDGGLYAEMLQNRAFQQVIPNTTEALYGWNNISAVIQVIADELPLSSALPNSLQFTIQSSVSGQVGFGNGGYYGIRVNSEWIYNASFYYRFPVATAFDGTATVALQSSKGEVYASTSVPINGSQTTWHQVTVQLTPTVSTNSTTNYFTLTFDGAEAPGGAINFALFSLFPTTFNKRQNGMRIDLANALYELKPSFLRFPGGNNLIGGNISVDSTFVMLNVERQGQNWTSRWVWNATLGPLVDRPGRWGDWGYINTDGLGLLEYLYFCEDLNMEPLMAVWSGLSLLNYESVPESDLAPYIQDAINQINFVIGDPETNEYAALRASLGHPEPFTLHYVEIGNEDFFASSSYVYRWRDFAGNLSAEFPQLQFIATTYPFNPVLDPVPKEYDLHFYNFSQWFIENAFEFDSYQRNGTYYFIGEYSAYLASDYPNLEGALGEAAFMTGFERNGDIVFASCYAPLLENINSPYPGLSRELVAFDAANIYPSTSYYVQQLFSTHVGTEYLPSTLPAFNGTLYWSVTLDQNASTLFIKVVNADAAPAPMTFALPFAVIPDGNLTVVTGSSPDASNTPTTPYEVVPVTSAMTFAQTFNYSAPAYSVSALTAYVL